MVILCDAASDAEAPAAWFAYAHVEASRIGDITITASSFIFVLSIR